MFINIKVFPTYFDGLRLPRKELWSKAWKQVVIKAYCSSLLKSNFSVYLYNASFHTNNLVESYHNQLKTFYVRCPRSVRVDRPIYLLSKVVAVDYYQEAVTCRFGFQAVKLTVEGQEKKKIADTLDYDIACGMLKEIEDSLFQCRSFTHDILYYDIEIRNSYPYSCSCPASSKVCKHIFLVNHMFQVSFTERSTLHVTPVTDENAALSNTIKEMPNAAFGNIQSTSNMDEREACALVNSSTKEKSITR